MHEINPNEANYTTKGKATFLRQAKSQASILVSYNTRIICVYRPNITRLLLSCYNFCADRIIGEDSRADRASSREVKYRVSVVYCGWGRWWNMIADISRACFSVCMCVLECGLKGQADGHLKQYCFETMHYRLIRSVNQNHPQ